MKLLFALRKATPFYPLSFPGSIGPELFLSTVASETSLRMNRMGAERRNERFTADGWRLEWDQGIKVGGVIWGRQSHRDDGMARDEVASVTCTHLGWRASWYCKGSWVSWEACSRGLLALGSENCFEPGLGGLQVLLDASECPPEL